MPTKTRARLLADPVPCARRVDLVSPCALASERPPVFGDRVVRHAESVRATYGHIEPVESARRTTACVLALDPRGAPGFGEACGAMATEHCRLLTMSNHNANV